MIIALMMFVTSAGVALATDSLKHASWPPLSPSEYDTQKFSLSSQQYTHGDVLIRIAQLKARPVHQAGAPVFCQAWIQVIKGKAITWQKHFDDIEPVGSSYGLFVPSSAPSPRFFAVVKTGDYDGRLFLVRRDGTVLDTLGGSYFLTRDRKFLVSEYASDLSGLTVVDLVNDRVLFTTEKMPYVQQWYRSGDAYYFTESEWLPSNRGQPTEKLGTTYELDFQKRRLVTRQVDPKTGKAAEKVTWSFDPRDEAGCTSLADHPRRTTHDRPR